MSKGERAELAGPGRGGEKEGPFVGCWGVCWATVTPRGPKLTPHEIQGRARVQVRRRALDQ